jgi:chromosome partitioning protein
VITAKILTKEGKNMKTLSKINLKGGVGKTTIAVNTSHILSKLYGARVLLIDNDKQANATSFFKANQEDQVTISDVLSNVKTDIREAIQKTAYKNLDIIACDYSLPTAIEMVMQDTVNPQHDRYQKALEKIKDNYDICIIDNPPDTNIAVLNALVATDEVIIVATPDEYSLQGMQEMQNYIDSARFYKKNLLFRGCLLNHFTKTPNSFKVKAQIKNNYPVFNSNIRYTKDKLNIKIPAIDLSPNCGFSIDIKRFVKELIGQK